MTPSRLGPAWWVVATGCVVSVAVIVLGSVRAGGYLLAAVLALGALGRLVLPEAVCAGLIVRTRGLDTAMYVAMAAAVTVIFSQVKLP